MNRPRTNTRRSNTLDNNSVMEINRKLATETEDGPFEIGVTLACLLQAEKLTIVLCIVVCMWED